MRPEHHSDTPVDQRPNDVRTDLQLGEIDLWGDAVPCGRIKHLLRRLMSDVAMERLDLRGLGSPDDGELFGGHVDAVAGITVDGGLSAHHQTVIGRVPRIECRRLVGITVVEPDVSDPGVLEKANVRSSVLDVVQRPKTGHQNPAEMRRTPGAELNEGRSQRWLAAKDSLDVPLMQVDDDAALTGAQQVRLPHP